MTTCTWYYGETGTGKSERAFKDYDHNTHYHYVGDNGWWDGYEGQHTVILNDFNGHIRCHKVLK